jgi:hypothetical protein
LNIQEKALYHQIHPIKLTTDISTSLVSLYFFWTNDLVIGLLIGILPSILVSVALIQVADLNRLKNSRLGGYIANYMTSRMQGLRLVGQVVIWVGAWYHVVFVVIAGFLAILVGWTRGKIFP